MPIFYLKMPKPKSTFSIYFLGDNGFNKFDKIFSLQIIIESNNDTKW